MSNAALKIELRRSIRELDASVEAVRRSFDDEVERGLWTADSTVYDVRDANGRPLLLDALAAKAQALAALAQLSG